MVGPLPYQPLPLRGPCLSDHEINLFKGGCFKRRREMLLTTNALIVLSLTKFAYVSSVCHGKLCIIL